MAFGNCFENFYLQTMDFSHDEILRWTIDDVGLEPGKDDKKDRLLITANSRRLWPLEFKSYCYPKRHALLEIAKSYIGKEIKKLRSHELDMELPDME